MLCVRVEKDGDPVSTAEVSLERKLAGKGAAKGWQAVGDVQPLSHNGTTCREVDGDNKARFRFSAVVGSEAVRSDNFEVINSTGNDS